jgi:hypothetical protein
MSVSRSRRFLCTTLVVAGAVLVFAAPAYADAGFPPVWKFETVFLVIGAVVVLAVAGLSFRFLRKAAAERRLDREAAERWAQRRAVEQDEAR